MTPQSEVPQVDLSAGLRPMKKAVVPKIDLSAGLVAKVKGAPALNDRSLGEAPPQQPSSANPSVAARKTKMRPPAVVSPLRGEPVADEQYQGAQAEPPSIPEPVPASHESMRQPSPVIPEPPSDQEAAPSVRPRVTRLPGSAENARPVGPQQFRGREHQPAGSTPQTPVAPPSYPETLPAQSWERLPTRSDSFQLETAAEPECKPEAEETPFNAATRMSGLRNLIFSLGLKNMHQEEDERELAAEPPPPVEPVRQRQVHTQPYAPMPQVPPRRESESASPTLVTAPPEFLPPKPLEETAENEHRVNGKSTSRRDRRDTYDDVQILPSWRGQYKRKG